MAEMSEKEVKAPAREVRMEDAALQPIATQTDAEKASSYAASHAGVDHKKGITAAERKLLLKLDMVILPLTILVYLSAYLDRGNIGNARLQGLEAQVLSGSDTNYSIVFSIPGTLAAKQFLPSHTIGAGALIWSIASSSMAGAHNLAGVVVCRLFIGLGEAFFGQAVSLHYSLWYKKDEIAKRLGLFIGAAALAGAFGGLIAYGVSEIKNPAIATWRVLFLIEGLPSVLLAITIILFLPSRPSHSKYIDENERTLIHTRLNADSLGEGGLGIDWSGVRRALTNWQAYVIAILYSCMNLTLGSVSGYLPTLVKGLGYSAADAQLYTVPPYAVALVLMVTFTYASDKMQSRGPFAAVVFVISLIGWIILLTVESNLHARYFGCFCIVSGGYVAIPIIIAWTANNCGSQSQRATQLGMLNSIGQCLSILAAFIFPSSEGPRFIKGCSINVGFMGLAITISIFMTLYFRWENRRRDRVEGGRPPAGEVLDVVNKHDLAPGFRYVP